MSVIEPAQPRVRDLPISQPGPSLRPIVDVVDERGPLLLGMMFYDIIRNERWDVIEGKLQGKHVSLLPASLMMTSLPVCKEHIMTLHKHTLFFHALLKICNCLEIDVLAPASGSETIIPPSFMYDGYTISFFAVEVGCRGLIAKSCVEFLETSYQISKEAIKICL
jgi:hypothetical protein